MLQALLVTFREGLESFLIVGVITAYLRRAGRERLIRGVRVGVVVSVVTCVAGAALWQMVPNQPLYEGIAALTAALLVGLLLWQMLRLGRRIKGEIESKMARVVPAGRGDDDRSIWPLLGVAAMTALLITREGLEAVLYLGVQSRMAGAASGSLVGAGLGLLLAGVIAWGWARLAPALNLGVVLKVTAVFLTLFLLQLVVYGIHELAESGIIPGSEAFHDATEVAGPDGWIGHLLSYSLIAAPILYLVWSRRSPPRPQAQPQPPRPPATAV